MALADIPCKELTDAFDFGTGLMAQLMAMDTEQRHKHRIAESRHFRGAPFSATLLYGRATRRTRSSEEEIETRAMVINSDLEACLVITQFNYIQARPGLTTTRTLQTILVLRLLSGSRSPCILENKRKIRVLHGYIVNHAAIAIKHLGKSETSSHYLYLGFPALSRSNRSQVAGSISQVFHIF